MKITILYDSVYGNTAQLALAMRSTLSPLADVTALTVKDAQPDLLAHAELLIVGAPTQRFNVTPAMTELLNRIPDGALRGMKVAAFDTRLTEAEIKKNKILGFFVKRAGKNAWGATALANQLSARGGELVAAPEGFYVTGTEGPLVAGETERAAAWARQLLTPAE